MMLAATEKQNKDSEKSAAYQPSSREIVTGDSLRCSPLAVLLLLVRVTSIPGIREQSRCLPQLVRTAAGPAASSGRCLHYKVRGTRTRISYVNEVEQSVNIVIERNTGSSGDAMRYAH